MSVKKYIKNICPYGLQQQSNVGKLRLRVLKSEEQFVVAIYAEEDLVHGMGVSMDG